MQPPLLQLPPNFFSSEKNIILESGGRMNNMSSYLQLFLHLVSGCCFIEGCVNPVEAWSKPPRTREARNQFPLSATFQPSAFRPSAPRLLVSEMTGILELELCKDLSDDCS